MKKILLLLAFVFPLFRADAQIQWQRCFGGRNTEVINEVHQTADGGYIAVGVTMSTDDDVVGNHGSGDAWVLKLSSTGDIEWERCFGGSDIDGAGSILQTTDGGFIFSGYSVSNDGDVSGLHSSTDTTGDCWVVKLSATGSLEWQRCLGGSKQDDASEIKQTADGGYIVAGSTYSADGDVTGQHGGEDAWVVKLSATGTIEWQKAFGGQGNESAVSICQTFDGGYIFTGTTTSADGDIAGLHGKEDFWVVKLYATGSIEWQRPLGGTEQDDAYAIQQTMDSGYIVTGVTWSTDGDIDHPGPSCCENYGDLWVVKLSPSGAIQWNKSYDNHNTEIGRSICQVADSGYVLCGVAQYLTISSSGHITLGREPLLVVRLSANGDIKWQLELCGKDAQSYEQGFFISPTSDGGFITGGVARSNDGDVSGNHGGDDGWIIKIGDKPSGVPDLPNMPELAIMPNPASNELVVTASDIITDVTIANLLGQAVSNVACHTMQLRMDIANLPPAIYFVRVNNTEVRRFVKQ